MARQDRWDHLNDGASVAAEGRGDGSRSSSRQQQDERRSFIGRVRWLVVLFVMFALVVLVRLLLSQIGGLISGSSIAAATSEDASRGRIVDNNGLPLAMDGFSWEIYVSPDDYRRAKADPARLPEYAAKLGVSAEALADAVAGSGAAALVARGVTEAQCDTADHDENLPGWMWCDGRRKRTYLHSALAAHILGFVDADQVGRAGVEAYYDDWLRASSDWPQDRLPGDPQALPAEWRTYLPSPSGRDIVLNMNAGLQFLVEQHLAKALEKHEARAGTVIVMDPQTGAILALANSPTYDPGRYTDYMQGQWGNAALSEAYEPGSVFKPITYAAAIDAGRISPDDFFIDSGNLEIDGQIIENAERRAYGSVTAREALAKSINVVIARICLDMGADTFYRYVRQFRFGQMTEVDAGPESAGIVKWAGTEYWSRFDQAANAFGQGISVTPLQLASAIASIANGGIVMQPQIVRSLVLDGRVYTLPHRILGRAIRPETARQVTEMMVSAAESYATGTDLVPGFRVAGKTGTAEIPGAEGYTSSLTITSFVGFLPAAEPKILILVKVTEPKSARWAEQVALPLFGQIARDAVQALKIQPDDRMP